MQTIGASIRAKRKSIDVKEGELAKGLGVSSNTISRWEHDESYPSLMNVIALADFFECSVDELLGRKELTE